MALLGDNAPVPAAPSGPGYPRNGSLQILALVPIPKRCVGLRMLERPSDSKKRALFPAIHFAVKVDIPPSFCMIADALPRPRGRNGGLPRSSPAPRWFRRFDKLRCRNV